MSLHERLNEKDENIVDRRKVSEDSRQYLAECIQNEDQCNALEKLFEVLTGDDIEDYPPVRDILGEVTLSDEVKDELEEDQQLVLEIELDDDSSRVFIEDESAYRFNEIEDGEYDLDVLVKEVRERDEEEYEYFDVTEYDVEFESNVTVDTKESEFGEFIEGASVEVIDFEYEEGDN